MQKLGFVPLQADTSIFIFNQSRIIIYMLIYVDDIIITSSSQEVVDKLIQKLSTDFAVKDLSNLHYFLGVEARHDEKRLVLAQTST